MGKWKEGWHPTSRVKYPRILAWHQLPTKEKQKMWRSYRDNANNLLRLGYKTVQEEFSISMYCRKLENAADIKTEERRLQEHYVKSLYS